jgi:6-phosphogluconolactonase
LPGSQVVRLPSVDAVAQRVAADVLALLREAQAAGRDPHAVLTGGSVSRTVHAAMAAADESPDWGRVDFWWGDERYVAGDDEERNAGQAWEDLLARVPVAPERVHAMPAADDHYLDVEAAAWAHAEELSAAMQHSTAPWFDVLMLGIGPDGHCASLFPGRGELDSEAVVLAVQDSPKPPPVRITMGMVSLRRARHVVFVATGEEKADAVARSVAGGALRETPAAGPRGLESTTWYVDDLAAAQL